MEAVDKIFDDLAKQVGFAPDQLKYLFVLLACYPAAFIFKALAHAPSSVKHLYSIVLSISFVTFCLGPFAWIHSFISSFVTYAILWVFPWRVSHKIAVTWVLSYMTASHLYRMYVDYMGWTLDFTTMQMVLTIKLWSFAFNYYDGKKQNPTEEQRKRSIKELPSLLEYYGFVYFFCSFMAGPAIEIKEYQDYISLKMFDDKKCKGKIPGTFIPAAKAFLQSLVFLPLTMLSAQFPIQYLVSDTYLLHTSWPEKIFRLWLHPTLMRMKYYFGWFMAEGACNACGIGYNGYDEKTNTMHWNRCRNVYVLRVEAAENIRSVTTYWNLKTGDWLKNYVYLRVAPEGSKPTFAATVITYAASAFWHGFYPGYYLFFLTTAIYTEVARDLRRVIRPLFMKKGEEGNYPLKYLYDIATIIITSIFLNYAGASFLLLSYEQSMKLYKNFYFSGLIIPIILLIVLRFGVPAKRPSKGAAKKE